MGSDEPARGGLYPRREPRGRNRSGFTEGFQRRPRVGFLRGLRRYRLSPTKMSHPPHARSERRDIEQSVRRGDEIDRRRVRRFVEAHGRNHRPARTEENISCGNTWSRSISSTDFSTLRISKAKQPSKCKQRFEKNRDKLFTFLRYDGVPWNNNNAEHAIKAFARLRDVISGSSTKKGVDEYLTLLSVAETCEYQGLDFLDFLRSRERMLKRSRGAAAGLRRKTLKIRCGGDQGRDPQQLETICRYVTNSSIWSVMRSLNRDGE